jgi:CBS domain-containing protein
MRVETILSSKGHDVASISQERSVSDAVSMLRERGIGALVVSGDQSPIVGMFSERDVVRALALHGATTLSLQVRDLMSTDITVCQETTSVTELMSLMTSHRIRHVPVVREMALIGLISIGDIVKARLDELEHDKKELLEYVQAR